MAKKSSKFVLVDLSDPKAKELSEVISSGTSRKILDYMAEIEKTTETEVSKSLKVAASTVHYHITKLVEAGMIESVGFTYSTKGREVMHYSLANKYIIIAPKKTNIKGLAARLKGILPALGVVAIVGGLIDYVVGSARFAKNTVYDSSSAFVKSAPETLGMIVDESATESMDMVVEESVQAFAEEASSEIVQETVSVSSKSLTDHVSSFVSSMSNKEIMFWIILGAVLGISLYVFFEWLMSKRK